jgi:hypothetical protein
MTQKKSGTPTINAANLPFTANFHRAHGLHNGVSAMGLELTELCEEVRRVRAGLDQGDARTNSRIDKLEASLNALLLKSNRPGPGRETADDEVAERADARSSCIVKHALTIPRNDGNTAEYTPSASEIDEALLAKKAIRSLFRHGDQNRLPLEFRKSLTSFSLGANAFILAPEMSKHGPVMSG